MSARGYPSKSRHWFPLTPGGYDNNFIVQKIGYLFNADFHIRRNCQIPQRSGNIDTDLDASAVDNDLFAPSPGDINDELNPGDSGGNQRNNDTPLTAGDNLVLGLTDLLVRDGIALIFHIGGIG